MLLTVDETVAILKISKATLYRWRHQKKIKYIKLGSRLMFDKKYIEEFIESRTVNTE